MRGRNIKMVLMRDISSERLQQFYAGLTEIILELSDTQLGL